MFKPNSFLSAHKIAMDKAKDRNLFIKRLKSEIEKIGQLGKEPIWQELSSLAAAGKLLRPLFAYQVFRSYHPDKTIPNRLIKDIAALELIHTSTLIHDDIIDKSEFRRECPTIHFKYNEEVALLIGNIIKDYAINIVSPKASKILNMEVTKLTVDN